MERDSPSPLTAGRAAEVAAGHLRDEGAQFVQTQLTDHQGLSWRKRSTRVFPFPQPVSFQILFHPKGRTWLLSNFTWSLQSLSSSLCRYLWTCWLVLLYSHCRLQWYFTSYFKLRWSEQWVALGPHVWGKNSSQNTSIDWQNICCDLPTDNSFHLWKLILFLRCNHNSLDVQESTWKQTQSDKNIPQLIPHTKRNAFAADRVWAGI